MSKIVVCLAERVQFQVNINNEMAENINELGEKGRRYRQEVVGLRDVIAKTHKVGKRLAWRNKQSQNEVESIEKYISKKKKREKKTLDVSGDEAKDGDTAELAELKGDDEEEKDVSTDGANETQGKLVDSRRNMVTKRENLNQSIDEHDAVLDDVKEGVHELQEAHDRFTTESATMEETLSNFQETVEKYDTHIKRIEDLREYSQTPMDAGTEEMKQYLSEVVRKRERLRKLTMSLELAVARELFLSRQSRTGESGMSRETFEAILAEIPTAAQRAIRNMGEKATFGALRVKSKKKIMDTKIGRKKKPGIDSEGMRNFLDDLQTRMEKDMKKPLRSLLVPGGLSQT